MEDMIKMIEGVSGDIEKQLTAKIATLQSFRANSIAIGEYVEAGCYDSKITGVDAARDILRNHTAHVVSDFEAMGSK